MSRMHCGSIAPFGMRDNAVVNWAIGSGRTVRETPKEGAGMKPLSRVLTVVRAFRPPNIEPPGAHDDSAPVVARFQALADANRLSCSRQHRHAPGRCRLRRGIHDPGDTRTDLRRGFGGILMKVMGHFVICSILLLYTFAEANEIPEEVIKSGQAIYKFDTPRRYATGFFINPNIFVTNFHAIDKIKNLNEISLQKINRSSIKVKKILAVSAYADLAILRTNKKPAVFLSEGLPPKDNEDLFILGHLNGNDELRLMRKTGDIKLWSDLYYEMPVDFSGDASGMSGSPLLDSQGEFIGVVSKHVGNINSSIISNYLEKLLNGRVGTVCRNKARACIEKEMKVVQNQVEDYLISDEFTSSITFFHADLKNLIQDSEDIGLYLFKGARQGNVDAQYNLGVVYDEGEGVEQDHKQASYWYKKAAEQGDASAQHNLAVQYFYGNGVEESIEQTVYWFTKAAEQGNENAKNALDTLRSRGYID